MKKIFLIFLAAITVFSAACSSTDNNTADTTSAAGTNTPQTASSSTISADTVTTTADDTKSQQTESKEENTMNIKITVSGHTFSATLYDNETAAELKKRLPLTLDMSELNGNEKYYYFSDSLPKNTSKPSGINAGDIMLYGSDCLVIFYESFSTSYSYTPIGKIDDTEGLAEVLGSGSVRVSFE